MSDNNLRVTATDLETTMSAVINVEADDSGSVAVPARLLLETMKTFPEQPLTFTLTDQNTSKSALTMENMLWLMPLLKNFQKR